MLWCFCEAIAQAIRSFAEDFAAPDPEGFFWDRFHCMHLAVFFLMCAFSRTSGGSAGPGTMVARSGTTYSLPMATRQSWSALN
eukprot:3342363-Amphidinium_carterae.1